MRHSSSCVTLLLLAVAAPAAAQEVASVTLSHKTLQLRIGQRMGVYATANDARGVVLVSQRFEWTSSDPRVVRVEVDRDQPDLAYLTGVSEGLAQVQVRVGPRTDAVAVQVARGEVPAAAGPPAAVLRIEPGNIVLLPVETRELGTVFLREDGSPGAPSAVSWRSHNPAVATVTDEGRVVGQSEGRGVIEARAASGLVATASVEVRTAPLGFQPPIVSLSPGGEVTAQVVVPSQGGRALPNAAFAWKSADESVARVSPLGVVHAVGPGRTGVQIEGLGQSATLAVSVHRPVAELELLPRGDGGPVTVPLRGGVPFTVRALDAQGQLVAEAPMLWTVADTSVAQFDTAARVLRGLALGQTELRLRGPGPAFQVRWQVQVIAGGLLVAPSRAGLAVRDSLALSASYTDDAGRPIGPASDLTWTTSNAAVVAVTAAGTITAVGTGRGDVVAATPWGKADTTVVFVQGRLLFTSTRGGSPDLHAVDPEATSAVVRLTSDPGVETMGAYSPDGASIVYVSNRDGPFDLYVANADGTSPRRLTNTPATETTPRWTPDGRHIVFGAQPPGGRAQVWIVPAAGGAEARALTSGEHANFEPAVSPDGRTIAFSSTRDGNYEIYLMAIDGSEQRNVSRSALKESHPAWFPGGQLAYVQEQGTGGRITPLVVRHDLATGQLAPLTPPNLAVTDFAISGKGDLLALEVSIVGGDGQFTRRLVFFHLSGGARVEMPLHAPGEQHSSPAFRPPLTP